MATKKIQQTEFEPSHFFEVVLAVDENKINKLLDMMAEEGGNNFQLIKINRLPDLTTRLLTPHP
jgi:hypothetical protein